MLGLTIISKKELQSLKDQLKKANETVKLKIQLIQTLNTENELLTTKNQEMYNKIHCKPHDNRGRFCSKKEDSNEGAN